MAPTARRSRALLGLWRTTGLLHGRTRANIALARYKMFQYVYKHHIRNITDALLIDIIISVLGQEKESFDQEILPVQDPEQVNNDKLLSNFVYWTDNTMRKALSEKGGPSAANKIAKFSKRDLYKRAFAVTLDKDDVRLARQWLKVSQKEYQEKQIPNSVGWSGPTPVHY